MTSSANKLTAQDSQPKASPKARAMGSMVQKMCSDTVANARWMRSITAMACAGVGGIGARVCVMLHCGQRALDAVDHCHGLWGGRVGGIDAHVYM